MGEISIAYASENEEAAQSLANFFIKQGHAVFSCPAKLDGCEQYRQSRYSCKIQNAANIALMSISMFRENKFIIEHFATSLDQNQENIHIVSLDEKWPAFNDTSLDRLKKHSWLSVSSNLQNKAQNIEAIGKAILNRISSASDWSHMTCDRVRHLLQASYDQLELVENVNEQKGTVNFSVFDGIHRTTQEVERYVVLYRHASNTASAEYLKKCMPHLLERMDRLIVVRSQPQHELSARQKEGLIEFFPTAKVVRFETLVMSGGDKGEKRETYTDPDEFLIPQNWKIQVPFGETTVETNTISDWCLYGGNNRDRGIVFLTGAGGAGKTHFVRFLNDRLVDEGREVFFLSARSLRSIARTASIGSLYDAYCLCRKSQDLTADLTRELFNLKFLVDRPYIIVDGLEEMVTMLGERFNVVKFFEDCQEKFSDAANGRMIVTSRDGQVPQTLSDYLQEFRLLPFDREQALEFFKRRFENDNSTLAGLAISVFDQIYERSELIPPLFCYLIATEVKKSKPEEIQSRVSKGEYRATSKVEDFTRSILGRESRMGISWPIEDTFRVLGELAILRVNGPLDFDVAKNRMQSLLDNGKHSDQQIKSAIKNFVFFEYHKSSNSLTFRYDFLRTVFLADFIVKKFEAADIDKISQNIVLTVLETNLVPNSDVLKKIVTNIETSDGTIFCSALEMILEAVLGNEIKTHDQRQRDLIISNLFYLHLSVIRTSMNPADNTKELKKFFATSSSSNEILAPKLLLYSQEYADAFKFDVSGLSFYQGHFSGFLVDKWFEVDRKTKFFGCTFEAVLSNTPSKNATIWHAQFDEECTFDDSFRDAVVEFSGTLKTTIERRYQELKAMLCEFSNGQAVNKYRTKSVVCSSFTSRIGLDGTKVFDTLLEYKLLEPASDRTHGHYQVPKEKRGAVRTFLQDDIIDPIIEIVVQEIQ